MNDLIDFFKEPFERRKTHKAIDKKDTKLLLNYITNLQQKTNNQKDEINVLWKRLEKLKKRHEYLKYDLKDYKSRNEKAVEKIVIKQARLINEKDYVITDLDLDEIMRTLESGE